MRFLRFLCAILAAGFLAQAVWAETADSPRPPAVAGAFYPGDSVRLARQVDEFFASAAPLKYAGRLIALLVPHAGYDFSGGVAAQAFEQITNHPETIVLLGTAHYAPVTGAALYAHGAYQTPLGPVPVDESMARELMERSPLFENDPSAHEREHSIEVELPFLQERLKDFKILPVLMNTNDPDVAVRIGGWLAESMQKRRALLVMSSDLAHYPAEALGRAVDATTLSSLTEMDPARYWKTSDFLLERREKALECTACGQAAIMAGLTAARALGAREAHLLRYLNSGDVPKIGDAGRTVGYAAMAFYTHPGVSVTAFHLSQPVRSELIAQARSSIEEALAGKPYQRQPLSKLPELNRASAVFVTLTKGGQLRGCIGQLEATTTLLEAVRRFARAAAFEDPRFPAVTRAEWPSLRVEISVLSPTESLAGAAAVRPGMGVWARKGDHQGVFLPDVWKQLPKKERFLSELCQQKADLPPDCGSDPAVQWSMFTTEEFGEP